MLRVSTFLWALGSCLLRYIDWYEFYERATTVCTGWLVARVRSLKGQIFFLHSVLLKVLFYIVELLYGGYSTTTSTTTSSSSRISSSDDFSRNSYFNPKLLTGNTGKEREREKRIVESVVSW